MAIFLPTLRSKNLNLTPGERRFGTCLLRQLEDDYLCWVNAAIGPKQWRPDFVVLHPGRGILTLEVKDWKLTSLHGMSRHTVQLLTERGLKTVANPLELARTYAIEVKELLERDPLLLQQEPGRFQGHLVLPWGFGVVLTNITRQQFEGAQLDQAIPADKVICQDEMTDSAEAEGFQGRLWGMFNYHFGQPLTLAQIDRVRHHLFPEIRIQQGSLFDDPDTPPVADVVKIMDLEQERLARNLGAGHRLVHGVAGSGKTLLLAYRCVQLDRMGLAKPILVLCFNRTLAASLKQILAGRGVGDAVHVYHFHGWCKAMVDLYHLAVPEGAAPIYDRQVAAVMAGVEGGRVPRAQYAAVLIDEGHDFAPDWFRLLVQMIDPATNSLLLLYDDTQSIYGTRRPRGFSWASVGIEAQGRTTILKVNYRNTVEALGFAYRFISAYLGESKGSEDIPIVHPEFGGRHGARPDIRELAGPAQELAHLAAWIKARAEEGTPLHQIAVLCRYNNQIARWRQGLAEKGIRVDAGNSAAGGVNGFDPAADAVKILSMHASKGLEFRCVAVPDLGAMPSAKVPLEEEARLLYVALTRATEHLLVTYYSASAFTRQCAQAQDDALAA